MSWLVCSDATDYRPSWQLPRIHAQADSFASCENHRANELPFSGLSRSLSHDANTVARTSRADWGTVAPSGCNAISTDKSNDGARKDRRVSRFQFDKRIEVSRRMRTLRASIKVEAARQ